MHLVKLRIHLLFNMDGLFELFSGRKVSCRKGKKRDKNDSYAKNYAKLMGFDKFLDF